MAKCLIKAQQLKRRGIAIGMGVVYYVVFLACYGLVILPVYFYTGLTFQMLPGWFWIVSLVLAVAPLLWMPLDLERPSDFASWMLYLCLLLPANVMIFMVTSRPPAEAMQLAIAMFLAFAFFEIVRRKYHFKIKRTVGGKPLFTIAIPVVMILLTLAVFRLGGFKLQLSFSDVYDRRLEAREIVSGGSIMAYAMAFLKGVCVPIAVAIGVRTRKWGYIGIAALAVAAIFSLDGTKSTAVAPLVLALIAWMTMRKPKNVGFLLLGATICLVLLSILESTTVGTAVIAATFVRRLMAVPGQLTTYYWEFFSENPHVMMSDGLVGRLLHLESPYQLSTARLIGQTFFGSAQATANANANIWASAFADFGYAGMAMASVVAALILKLTDSLSTNGRFTLASVCCGAMGLTWVNGALQTSLLTDGILGLIVALWLFPTSSLASDQPAPGDKSPPPTSGLPLAEIDNKLKGKLE